MTDLPTGQPAEGAPAPAPDPKLSERIVSVISALQSFALAVAPYGIAVYAVSKAVELNDANFTKGLVYGLFSAALIAINPNSRGKAGQ